MPLQLRLASLLPPLLLLSDLLQQLLREAKMADIDLGGSKALIRLYYRLVAHPT